MTRDCIYDAPYWFRGFGELPARTHLRIYSAEHGSLPVVIATELDHNPGTSITNAAELLAQQVWDDASVWGAAYAVSREGFTWIEHYPGAPLPVDAELEIGVHEQFSIVTFDIGEDGNLDIYAPRRPDEQPEHPWQPVRREAVEALIGQPFPAVPDKRQLGDHQ